MAPLIFSREEANRIVRIPVAMEPHTDFMVWKGEASGEFSVRSAYKFLHGFLPNYLKTEANLFYKNLWDIHIPGKIKILIWKISWNFIHHFVNLRCKRLLSVVVCPKCGVTECSRIVPAFNVEYFVALCGRSRGTSLCVGAHQLVPLPDQKGP